MDTTNVILQRGASIDTLRLPESEEMLRAVNKIRGAVGSPRMPKYITSLTNAGLFRKFVRLMGKPNGHTKTAYLKLARCEQEDVLYRLIRKQRRAS